MKTTREEEKRSKRNDRTERSNRKRGSADGSGVEGRRERGGTNDWQKSRKRKCLFEEDYALNSASRFAESAAARANESVEARGSAKGLAPSCFGGGGAAAAAVEGERFAAAVRAAEEGVRKVSREGQKERRGKEEEQDAQGFLTSDPCLANGLFATGVRLASITTTSPMSLTKLSLAFPPFASPSPSTSIALTLLAGLLGGNRESLDPVDMILPRSDLPS